MKKTTEFAGESKRGIPALPSQSRTIDALPIVASILATGAFQSGALKPYSLLTERGLGQLRPFVTAAKYLISECENRSIHVHAYQLFAPDKAYSEKEIAAIFDLAKWPKLTSRPSVRNLLDDVWKELERKRASLVTFSKEVYRDSGSSSEAAEELITQKDEMTKRMQEAKFGSSWVVRRLFYEAAMHKVMEHTLRHDVELNPALKVYPPEENPSGYFQKHPGNDATPEEFKFGQDVKIRQLENKVRSLKEQLAKKNRPIKTTNRLPLPHEKREE